MKPRTLILRAAGTNCDVETAHAFELAGSEPVSLHINRLLEDPSKIEDFQLLAIPGGFSYGDDIAAGRILASQIVHHFADALNRFVEAGKPIIGICNGFQVLVRTGLLPGPIAGRSGQTCTLAGNDLPGLVDRWVRLSCISHKCIWTEGLHTFELPVAHGEGKFIAINEAVRSEVWRQDRVALVYARPDGSAAGGEYPANPNGSVDDIAGICDPSGLVLGLMPHPERFVSGLQHPAWSRRGQADALGDGLTIFQSAVHHVTQGVLARM